MTANGSVLSQLNETHHLLDCWSLGFARRLLGIVIDFGLPWSLVNGLYLPIHACRSVGLLTKRFLLDAWKQPLLCCFNFAWTLGSIRYLHPVLALETIT